MNVLIKEIKSLFNPLTYKGSRYVHTDTEIIEKLKKEKISIMEELITSNIVERYSTIFRFCELYQSWALEKKLQQSEDITRQENFEINPDLPLNIIH